MPSVCSTVTRAVVPVPVMAEAGTYKVLSTSSTTTSAEADMPGLRPATGWFSWMVTGKLTTPPLVVAVVATWVTRPCTVALGRAVKVTMAFWPSWILVASVSVNEACTCRVDRLVSVMNAVLELLDELDELEAGAAGRGRRAASRPTPNHLPPEPPEPDEPVPVEPVPLEPELDVGRGRPRWCRRR